MRSHCRSFPLAALVAMALSVGLPTAAMGSSLLSGYGGPGEGNQAILGSALLNGPGHGGGGGGSSGGGSTGGGSRTGAAAGGVSNSPSGGSAAPAAPAAGGHASAPGAGSANILGRTGTAPGHGSHGKTGAQRHAGASLLASAQTPAAGSGNLGLSGADLLYMLLAIGLLALTAALTSRLTSQSRSEASMTDAMSRRSRVTP